MIYGFIKIVNDRPKVGFFFFSCIDCCNFFQKKDVKNWFGVFCLVKMVCLCCFCCFNGWVFCVVFLFFFFKVVYCVFFVFCCSSSILCFVFYVVLVV